LFTTIYTDQLKYLNFIDSLILYKQEIVNQYAMKCLH
jgi:hypothetical protein